ncbi:hypothetical protein PG985_007998 [Apiospora marii]|uniref:uncharacterized protein n=1 Tax=Apiospora marii TaxID=335849 RepID=UPI00312E0C96
MKIFASILAFTVGFAFADGPIESTCSEWELWNPQPQVRYLQGHCLDNNGKSVCSHASLDACYGVDDSGALQPEQWGQGLVKCKNCNTDQLRLTCDCKDKNGNYVTTERGLDDAMTNHNGYLSCFGLDGVQCPDSK